ncbi:(Fe-S)-binding protein [Thermodesulfatator atlanticus]|uniref:(Fe-S)-binding protein n=1 Tax=Thermodesulfatator atlanticus TaxID=501497 RepID=UPI0003B36301|nr:(Fe-S)-binding protein [Thermodesulfatator atlanticus]
MNKFLREDFRLEPASCYVDMRCPRYRAVIPAEEDLSPLMPYINRKAQVVFYDPKEPVIIFKLEGKKVALRTYEAQIANIKDIEEGKIYREKLAEYLDNIWLLKDSISPLYEPKERPPALTIYKLLPKTNCRACGEATCLAFASRLATGEAELSACRPLYEDKAHAATREELEKIL